MSGIRRVQYLQYDSSHKSIVKTCVFVFWRSYFAWSKLCSLNNWSSVGWFMVCIYLVTIIWWYPRFSCEAISESHYRSTVLMWRSYFLPQQLFALNSFSGQGAVYFHDGDNSRRRRKIVVTNILKAYSLFTKSHEFRLLYVSKRYVRPDY